MDNLTGRIEEVGPDFYKGHPTIQDDELPMIKQVEIILPDIKAVSRNETTGQYWKYRNVLKTAEIWMATYGKRFEYHFDKKVDVFIDAYFDTRVKPVVIQKGKRFGQKTNIKQKAADTPNIDDKIFTDILVRYKQQGKKGSTAAERNCWFIEDDNPEYLRYVTKQSIPSDHYTVVIRIVEV
jgi:hypothetical protein